MMNGYIDFHCHLDFKDFDENRRDLIDEIFNSDFDTILTVADPFEDGSLEKTEEILNYNKRILNVCGFHPHNAKDYSKDYEKKIADFVIRNNSIAIGEVGLDYHYNFSSPEEQRKVLRKQVNLAKELNLPLMIHSREAEEVVLRILKEENFNNNVVFHCFTGSVNHAKEIIDRGYYISFSGILTFKKSNELRDVAKITPVDRLFTETDSPFLSPEPFRGRTNTPLRVKIIANRLAEIKEIEVDLLNKRIKENIENFIENK